MAVIFVHADFDPLDRIRKTVTTTLTDLFAQDPRHRFGGRVDDGKDDAILVRKHPPTVAETGRCLGRVHAHFDLAMIPRQQHVMIPRGRDFQDGVAKGDEIDDVSIYIKRTFDGASDPVVVTVNSLTDVSGDRDEVGGREHELFLGDFDAVVRHEE